MKVASYAAQSRCEHRSCFWSVAVRVGQVVPIAGYPRVTAMVHSLAQAERIVRAHEHMHYRAHHRDEHVQYARDGHVQYEARRSKLIVRNSSSGDSPTCDGRG